jgi:hypothetical protein
VRKEFVTEVGEFDALPSGVPFDALNDARHAKEILCEIPIEIGQRLAAGSAAAPNCLF